MLTYLLPCYISLSCVRYKKYVMLDPLGVVTKTRQVLEDEIKGDLDAAPRSMCQEVVEFKIGENYFYSPTLQEVPQLDVPLDLPDLPGNHCVSSFCVFYVSLIVVFTFCLVYRFY